jgi:hypothetical protein
MKVLRYSDTFKVPETYLRHFFSDNSEYDKTIFILGIQCLDVSDLRSRFQGYRLIAYQLEQLFQGSPWLNSKTINSLNQVDEIWEYDSLNIPFYQNHVNKQIKHFPMNLYCPEFDNVIESGVKDIDFLFVGALNDRRMNVLNTFTEKTKHSLVIAMNTYDEKLTSLLDRSKAVINVHFFAENNRQEQVRLNPLLSAGIPVLSEASTNNYFGNYIMEFKNMNELVELSNYMIEEDRYKNFKIFLNGFKSGK